MEKIFLSFHQNITPDLHLNFINLLIFKNLSQISAPRNFMIALSAKFTKVKLEIRTH